MSPALMRMISRAMPIAVVALVMAQATSALELRVNRFTGSITISNPADQPAQNLDGYTIGTDPTFPPLEDVIVPAQWNSLTDQLFPGWQEVVLPGQEQKQVSELNLTSSTAFAPGAAVSLGDAYNVTQPDESLLSFQYKIEGEATAFDGDVIFEGGIHLKVNKLSGDVRIINGEPVPIDFDAYVILSQGSLLNPSALFGLHDQGVPGWVEASPATDAISELNLATSLVLAPGQSRSLGTIYSGGVAGAEDLFFQFRQTGVRILDGTVEYTTGQPGDFNVDEFVNAADYVVWRKYLGATDETGINGNGDGVNGVDNGDYQVWRTNFGASGTGALAMGAGVPEPSGVFMFLLGVLLCVRSRAFVMR